MDRSPPCWDLPEEGGAAWTAAPQSSSSTWGSVGAGEGSSDSRTVGDAARRREADAGEEAVMLPSSRPSPVSPHAGSSKGLCQEIRPPNYMGRPNRWCSSLGEKIAELKNEADSIGRTIFEKNGQKLKLVNDRHDLEQKITNSKRKRGPEELRLENKREELEDAKRASAVNNGHAAVDTTELEEDIKKEKNSIEQSEVLLQKTNAMLTAALREVNDRREAYKTFMDSVNDETGRTNDELELVKCKLDAAEQEKTHYEHVMATKVLPDIKTAEAEYANLQQLRQDYFKKASIIFPESDMEALNHVAGSTPEKLSAEINRLKQRLDQESKRYAESIDDLRVLHDKKERKILKKQQLNASNRVKINLCHKALDSRWKKLQRNAVLLKRQLTWLSTTFIVLNV